MVHITIYMWLPIHYQIQDIFKIFLKFSIGCFRNILKSCFFGATCIVLYMVGSKIHRHVYISSYNSFMSHRVSLDNRRSSCKRRTRKRNGVWNNTFIQLHGAICKYTHTQTHTHNNHTHTRIWVYVWNTLLPRLGLLINE